MTRRLLLLNGLATLMLGVHHASGYGFDAMFAWTDRYQAVTVPNYDQIGSLAFYVNILIQQIDFFALPSFMFVSGFFVAFAAGATQGKLEWNVVRTRAVNLFVPLVIWTAFFFLIFTRRLPSSLDDAIDRYYYIPLLIQFYFLAPLLVSLVTKWPKLVLLGAGLLELGRFSIRYFTRLGIDFSGQALLIDLTPRWLFPMLFFWFALGVVAGVHRRPFRLFLGRVKWVALATMLALLALAMVEYRAYANATGEEWLGPYFGGFARQFYALAFILAFLAFDKITIPFAEQLSYLGTKSLGVYLVHSRLMWLAAVFMYARTPMLLGNQFLYQLVLIVVSLGGSVLLMEALSRTRARKVYRYAFG